jgi:predicted transporter
MNPIIASSVDPTKLSNTIKGIIISLSSVIIFVASVYFNTSVSSDQVMSFANQTANTVAAVGIAFGALHTMYGLLVKALNKVTTKKNESETLQSSVEN